jgi:hypothetical protein
MTEADINVRRELLKKSALLGGAGVASAALMGGFGTNVLGLPSPSSISVMNQWDMVLTASCIVFVDSAGSFYVKDTGIGPDFGALIVDASVITAYGASLGAGNVGAITATAGIQEAILVLPSGGRIFLSSGTFNITLGIYIPYSGIQIYAAGRDLTVINFVGDITKYHGIFAMPGATSATDTGVAASVPMNDLVLSDFSVNMNSTWANFNSGETSGSCIKAVATNGALISRVNVYGMATYGIHLHTGLSTGSTTVSSNNNIVFDCNATVTGVVGFYSDSGYALGTGGSKNSNPNRGNRWIDCTATCSGKITSTSKLPCGFLTYGEIGTRFTGCVAQGFLGDTVGVNTGAGFLIEGIGSGTCLDLCDTIENDYGIYMHSANGVSVVNHVSWYDRYFSIGNGGGFDYGAKNIQIKNLICMDLGGSGHEGHAISLQGGTGFAPTQIDIDAVKCLMTGLNSPIYNQSPLAFFAILQIIGWSHCKVRGIDGAEMVGLGAHFLDLSGTNSDITIRDSPGFNPVNQITNPFGTASAGLLGFGGAAAVPVASKDYTAFLSDVFITAANSTNANNAIVVKDGAGNTIQSGLSTLTALYVPCGYKVNWGAFTGTAGAVTVWGV